MLVSPDSEYEEHDSDTCQCKWAQKRQSYSEPQYDNDGGGHDEIMMIENKRKPQNTSDNDKCCC